MVPSRLPSGRLLQQDSTHSCKVGSERCVCSLLEVDESAPVNKGDAALSHFTADDLGVKSDSGDLRAMDVIINTLQAIKTNASALEQLEQERSTPEVLLQSMRGFMARAGLKVEDLDRLNIIHVTGTKGKGSTCAFTEKILRSYGYRTGFFTSPHLIQFRERIRLNGQPIGEELFAKYFWHIYEQLDKSKDAHGGSMPTLFRFYTILAFHVFLQEKVDVALIEVGIGGEYDCTNVMRRPWVCGVTSLDIDHIQTLGNTLEKIAWHKGGIFKPGVPAFTVKQPENAMAVLRDRAKEIKCPLWVCPELEDYPTDCGPLRLSLAGKHQRSNASLALQLSNTWLQRRCLPGDNGFPFTSVESTGLPQGTPFKPSPIMVKGLAETEWLGRSQTVKHGAVTYFLDGAHTMHSIQACVDWFRETAVAKNASGPVVRVLMFNTTGERDSSAFLKLLVPCQFDYAVFCPIIAPIASGGADPQHETEEDKINECLDNERSWRLHAGLGDKKGTHLNGLVSEKKKDSMVFPCILSALQWITQGRDSVLADASQTFSPVQPVITAKAAPLCDAAEIHILVTGSLHLVSGILKLFIPASSK